MKSVPASHLALLGAVIIVFTWSAWKPHDSLTWLLEVFPGALGLIILLVTYRRFRFTTFCYILIALHISLLCVGGHYTYARVPLFDWFRQIFGWHRNHFDRLGHFAQGFVPAFIAREVFIRLHVLARPKWMPFLILTVCLAISATYELLEWCAALVNQTAAESFLGTQGDVWDTQEDMFMALIGAICALLLGPLHYRALQRIGSQTPKDGSVS